MAQLTIHGTWKSILGLAFLFAFVALVAFAVASGKSLGIWLYALAFAAMVFGFWSKEDHVAIGGIMGLSLLVILDILLRIGVLAFNECKPHFSAIAGC